MRDRETIKDNSRYEDADESPAKAERQREFEEIVEVQEKQLILLGNVLYDLRSFNERLIGVEPTSDQNDSDQKKREVDNSYIDVIYTNLDDVDVLIRDLRYQVDRLNRVG